MRFCFLLAVAGVVAFASHVPKNEVKNLDESEVGEAEHTGFNLDLASSTMSSFGMNLEERERRLGEGDKQIQLTPSLSGTYDMASLNIAPGLAAEPATQDTGLRTSDFGRNQRPNIAGMLAIGQQMDDNENSKRLVMGKRTNLCVDSLEVAKAVLDDEDFAKAVTFYTKWICDRAMHRKSRTHACCNANDGVVGVPTCDASFCWDTGEMKKFGKRDVAEITVGGEQHFLLITVEAMVKKASYCIKTGDPQRPTECYRKKDCGSLDLEIDKICKPDDQSSIKAGMEECSCDAGRCREIQGWKKPLQWKINGVEDNPNDHTEGPWYDARVTKAGTLTAMICAAS